MRARRHDASLTRRSFLASAGSTLLASQAQAFTPGVNAIVADGGRATMPVRIAPDASPRVQVAANRLAEMLGRIAGAEFPIEVGDAETGVFVGSAADAPDGYGVQPVDRTDIRKREDYVLRSHADGILLVGASDLGVEHAVWDFLYRIGYRQFFPGERWEVTPRIPHLSIAVDARESPDWHQRSIWPGFGLWDYNREAYADWRAKNRVTSGIELQTNHVYQAILTAEAEQFAKHPEYLGLVGGERSSAKFCISNPGLRRLVADYALRRFAEDPTLDSISMEPSDGGGWCECDECAKLGGISNRALTLANEVAAAVQGSYPGKLVGMLAYHEHSAPPEIEAHPQVVVCIATAFIKAGLPLDALIDGWSQKCSAIGIREYYSVNQWDRDRPAAARAGSIEYLTRSIPAFHAKGARFMVAEAGDNWGPNGLGYYLAARMLWSSAEAVQAAELVESLLEKAFGAAKEPMRDFYRQLDWRDPAADPPLGERLLKLVRNSQRAWELPHRLGKMFGALIAARATADSPEGAARISDLSLYARYVDLFQRYAEAKGEARQTAFESLIRHAYRMRTTMLVHAKALYRDLPRRDRSVQVPPDAGWRVEEGRNPWKSSEPFAEEEVVAYLREGAERYPANP